MVNERVSVPVEDRWNVEAIYPFFESWESEIKKWKTEEELRFPELLKFKNTLTKDPLQMALFLKG